MLDAHAGAAGEGTAHLHHRLAEPVLGAVAVGVHGELQAPFLGDAVGPDGEGRGGDHRWERSLEALTGPRKLGRELRSAGVDLGADIVGDEQDDSFAVAGNQPLTCVGEPSDNRSGFTKTRCLEAFSPPAPVLGTMRTFLAWRESVTISPLNSLLPDS